MSYGHLAMKIQNCLDAAKRHGRGALAYLPGGIYRITHTLQMNGADYGISGTGFRSIVQWAGAETGLMLRIHHPQNLDVEHLVMQAGPETVRIHHTADPGPSSIFYDGVYVNGLEACRTGL